jgi:hypothetical protein
MTERVLRCVAAGVFGILALAWIYGVLNTDRTDDSAPPGFWDSLSADLLIAGVLVAAGFMIGRRWAPALALLPAVLAFPAGYEPDGYPEVPIWFYLGFQGVIFGIPLVAGGVGLRWLLEFAIRGGRGSQRAPGSGPRAASRR